MSTAIEQRPLSGVAHVEFTRDGRYAPVSMWYSERALVVYDAATLSDIKRLPVNKPSGKHNVCNEISLSPGISH